MEWLAKFDIFHNKVLALISHIRELTGKNESLISDNERLAEEVSRLQGELDEVKALAGRYGAERDSIRKRVERIIQMID